MSRDGSGRYQQHRPRPPRCEGLRRAIPFGDRRSGLVVAEGEHKPRPRLAALRERNQLQRVRCDLPRLAPLETPDMGEDLHQHRLSLACTVHDDRRPNAERHMPLREKCLAQHRRYPLEGIIGSRFVCSLELPGAIPRASRRRYWVSMNHAICRCQSSCRQLRPRYPQRRRARTFCPLASPTGEDVHSGVRAPAPGQQSLERRPIVGEVEPARDTALLPKPDLPNRRRGPICPEVEPVGLEGCAPVGVQSSPSSSRRPRTSARIERNKACVRAESWVLRLELP